MIKAVIFDCFGVLASDGWLPFKERNFGHNPVLMAEATDLNKQADAGFITYDEFMQGVSNLAHVTLERATKEIEDNVPNEQLFAYATTLKPKYKLGMLSNAADDWLEEIFTTEHRALFDATALSFATGFIKPDERAYEDIAKRLNVDPANCLFIDDQERYCEGARDAGMTAIQFHDNQQVIRDISAALTES